MVEKNAWPPKSSTGSARGGTTIEVVASGTGGRTQAIARRRRRQICSGVADPRGDGAAGRPRKLRDTARYSTCATICIRELRICA